MESKFTIDERIIQDIKLLTARDDFSFSLEDLRQKHQPFFESQSYDEEHNRYDCDEALQDKFFEDAEKLCKEYKLSLLYTPFVESFIQMGNSGDHKKVLDMIYLNPYTKIETKDCVTLQIYPETTLDEVIATWPSIKSALSRMPITYQGRKNRIENLDRDLYILSLKRKGLTGAEIAKKTNMKYKKTRLGYEDIPIILKRLKARANRLMTSRQS